MPRLRPLAVLAVLAVSCTTERPLGPPRTRQPLQAELAALSSAPQVGISQVYGGGGNAGAPLNSDFIELFNPGAAAVDVSGWRLHYGSSAGTTWTNTTTLAGGSVIAPGHYFLVRESSGTSGAALPTPDAIGSYLGNPATCWKMSHLTCVSLWNLLDDV